MRALIGANLIDGTGASVINDSAVLIDGDRIKSVGPRAAVALPPNTQVTDVSGLTLLPGLIDCHDHLSFKSYDVLTRWSLNEPYSIQHLRTAKVMEQTLASGYTCVRDASGLDIGFKQAVESGLCPGPRLVISVSVISPTGGIGDRVTPSGHSQAMFLPDPRMPHGVANGVDEVRAKVREMARVGADVIKFATTGGASSRTGHGPMDVAFGIDEVKALVDEAKSLGRKTMCHALGGRGLRMCVEGGAASVEHGCYLAEDPDLSKMMADKGVFFVPTFNVYEYHSTVSEPHMLARAKSLMEIHKESLHQALAAGVKVVAGTDAGGFIHGDNAREIQILVERGMPPMQAIQAATGWAAECVGLEKDIGTVEPGKLADLLVVDGDPLRDAGVLRNQERIKLVMKGGEAFVDRLPAPTLHAVSRD
jgi:imidazolonepropionase-like amidohydrolase